MILSLKKDLLQFILHGNNRTLENSGFAVQSQWTSDVRYDVGVNFVFKLGTD